jgi:AraC-like DNA-binding protein
METISQIEERLRLKPETRIGGNGLADELKLSRFQLYRRVKAQTGISPKKLAGKNRIEQACDLLTHTDLSVAAVAAQIGIDDANYFARFFKLRTGSTPTHWRKQHIRRSGTAAPTHAITAAPTAVAKAAPDMPVHLL